MHILFVAAEALPYVTTGGFGETVASLAEALTAAGHRVSILLPRYRQISLRRPEVIASPVDICVGAQTFAISLLRDSAPGPAPHPEYYFVECPACFDRNQLYGNSGYDFPDNPERFSLLCRSAIELARRLRPDLIHAHEWHAALTPVLLRTERRQDAALSRLPTVFTIHNLGFQGIFPADVLDRVGLDPALFRVESLEYWGKVNFLKGALLYADVITTVSPSYAGEIQTPEYGMGLDGVLRKRASSLYGILNGIDTRNWDPSRDPSLVATYTVENLGGKEQCRRALIREFGLQRGDRPIMAFISRLTAQKGIELLDSCLDRMSALGITLIVLGQGEAWQEQTVRRWEHRFPEWIRIVLRYDEELAHRLTAGADLFLMPSRYEPCGLTQMQAMRYGTVPIVHATGGLKDSVMNWNPAEGTGNGFSFVPYHADALLHSLAQALEAYGESPSGPWRQLQRNGMEEDWSWDRSSLAYAMLYRRLVPGLVPAAVETC